MDNKKRKYLDNGNTNEPVKKKIKIKHDKPYIKISLNNIFKNIIL